LGESGERAEGEDGESKLTEQGLYSPEHIIDRCTGNTVEDPEFQAMNDHRISRVLQLTRRNKVADVARFIPQTHYLLFTPEGKIIAKPGADRRYQFPTVGTGSRVPYELPVEVIPPGGIEDEGFVGHQVSLAGGQTDQIPDGYEAHDPQDVLRNLYGSMGLKVNRPYQALDRAYSRAILRALKRSKVSAPTQSG
jgi:hypothetical protein